MSNKLHKMVWIKCKKRKVNWKGLKVEGFRVVSSFSEFLRADILLFPPSDFCMGQGSSCAGKPDQVSRKGERAFFTFWIYNQGLWSGFLLLGGGKASALAFSLQGGCRKPVAAGVAAILGWLWLLWLWLWAVSWSEHTPSRSVTVWLGTR